MLTRIVFFLVFVPLFCWAQPSQKVIFGCYAEDLEAFEAFATRARESGATHIVLTAEDLPWARWQYDTPGDPYPAWAISNVGLLKIATPDVIKPHIPQDYAEEVLGILEARCKVLRKLGLKAAFTTFEPQMLPESVYEEYPMWRGPQVEHPLRAIAPRFTPAVEHPEVQQLYTESIKILLKRCPEIEIISLHTNDSGTGMSWSQGLYPGANGNTLYQDQPMHTRYFAFFNAIQQGAKEMGSTIEIDAEWVREQNPEYIAQQLKPGMALKNLEGPDATKYKNTVGFLLDYDYVFYPVRGIPFPVRFLTELQQAAENPAPRLFVLMGDRFNTDLYFDLYDRFQEQSTTTYLSRMNMLRTLAAQEVGEAHADHLLDVWRNLYEAHTHQWQYNQGGYWFYIGSVHQRWLTRPFVPFPEELTKEEVSYYRPYLFQARSEERAQSLAEIQSTYFFEGFGGHFLNDRILQHLKGYIGTARENLQVIIDAEAGDAGKLQLLDKRLHAFECIVNNCIHAVSYQYFVDVSKEWNLKHRPMERLWHYLSVPERTRMMAIARQELDNAATLIELLESTEEPILHLADTKAEEDIRILGPDLVAQLRKKMKLMIAHWEDHERLFVED
ncbi:hypothetical protein [Marinoscillum furvescens]|uniref:Uncharacterized protein n=1 Tax=Marinoscillum furvescens DSM 4134 TaxID=1122208 RepID=A0A3D9L969_MARFU|nr:hypothetical protein [Marinoscillum furvescens]REE02017.1 hypothetical protein C7460_10235 [Marinoscillum furvescens DSM 4134]